MRKRNLFVLVSVLLMSIVLGSCSQSADYQSVIPAEPVIVVKANVDRLLTKSEVLQDNQVTGLLKTGINEMPENSRELMRGILNDPANCGLDLKQPAFVVMDNIEQTRGFVLFAVKDIEKVKGLFGVVEENNEDISLEENGDYYIVKSNNSNTVAFDNTKLIVAFAQGAFDATEYITATENGTKSDALKNFIASDNDMAYYMAYKDILRLAEGLSPETAGSIDTELFENAKLICALNFEAGKIVMNSKLEDADELMAKSKEYWVNPNTELQEYFPAASYGYMQIGAKDMGTNIEENVPEAQRQILDELLSTVNRELKKNGADTEFTWSMLNSLDGTIAFGVSEADMTSIMPLPQMTLIAECQDKALFELIAELLVANRIASKSGEDTYSIMGMYNFAYVDNKMVAMPSNMFGQYCAGGSINAMQENLSENEMTNFIGNDNGMVIDIQAIADMVEQMGLIKRNRDRAALNILRNFTYSAYTINEDLEFEWVTTFKDGSTNSLKQIKDMAVAGAINQSSF